MLTNTTIFFNDYKILIIMKVVALVTFSVLNLALMLLTDMLELACNIS